MSVQFRSAADLLHEKRRAIIRAAKLWLVLVCAFSKQFSVPRLQTHNIASFSFFLSVREYVNKIACRRAGSLFLSKQDKRSKSSLGSKFL